MASYNELNALIDAYINRNGVQAITGQILNGVLKAMVSQLGRGYTIMGAATPATDPGTPDGPECYFASETGTYTDFNGLQIVPGELALLCYTPSDGWTKATIYEGFRQVGATIDGNVGTPSVGVSYADGVLSFDFHNMKGNTGDAAGFGTIGADIAGGVGTPGVSVESSGPATAKNLQFHFTNLKGETGVTSVVATVDNTTGTPACTVSLVGQQLTLAFTGLKGAQGDTGSSVDYPFTIVNNLTTDDATQALSAAQGVVLEGEITQLEAKVDRLVGKEIFTRDGYYKGTNGSFVSSTIYKATPLLKLQGADIQGIFYLPNAGGVGQLVFFDEGKNFLGQYTTEPSGTRERTIPTSVFPQNSFYVGIVTVATELSYSWVSLGVVNSVVLSDLAREENKELSEKTLPTVERFKNYGRELFSLDGKMYAAISGNLISNSAYLGTPILELSGDINGYFYIGGTQYTNYGVSFYDANKAFISGYTGTGNAGMKEIHIPVSGMPANAKYFAVSTIKAMSSDATLVCGWLGEMYRLAEKVEKPGDVDARLVALEESVLEEISQSVVPSKHKRIGIFLDTTPNREKYYLSVTCERTDISSFTIFKCTTAHDGLTNYKTARFGEKVLIERDSAKPSLYIYQSTAPDENFENEVNYTIVYERATETVQGDIKEIYSEIQSWKGKNIVVFGDSITEFYFDFNGVRMGYCDWIAKITGANVINVGIGGTRLCPRAKLIPVFDETESYLVGDIVYYNDGNGWECYQFTSAHSGAWDSADVAVMTYSTLTGYPDLDIYNLVAASCDTTTAIEHRFDNQIAAAAYLYAKSGSDDNRTIITRLSGIDWSEVDAVIVTGGTNDWGTSGIGELTDADATTLRGAINSIVKKLLSTYKYLKLYWFTCPPNWQNYTNGQPLPPVSDFSDTFTRGGKTLRELASIIKDAVVYNHIPVGDMYNEIGWNTNNFPYYFNAVDGTHPGRGYEQIARYMVSKIKSYQTF